jgi:cellulase/cellobiase CelA1
MARTTIRMITGRGRNVACAAAAVLAIGGTAAALALSQPSGKAPTQQTTAALCGLVACANVPSQGAPAPTASASSTALGPGGETAARPASPSVSSAPAGAPSPRPAPSTQPGPTVSSPSLPDVTVAYSSQQRWHDGFHGQLTLDNQGSSAVTGWQVAITLPGDQVRYAWNANWSFGGDVLTLTPASNDQVIEPGASVTVNFFALGGNSQPANCTFDGSACR